MQSFQLFEPHYVLIYTSWRLFFFFFFLPNFCTVPNYTIINPPPGLFRPPAPLTITIKRQCVKRIRKLQVFLCCKMNFTALIPKSLNLFKVNKNEMRHSEIEKCWSTYIRYLTVFTQLFIHTDILMLGLTEGIVWRIRYIVPLKRNTLADKVGIYM